jgi:capsule polysaccharide export protein KpsC/LpsZ
MIDWLTTAAAAAGRIPDMTLVVRVHPGEAKWGTNEGVEASLLSQLGECPPNVRVVPSTEPLDSYVLMDLSDLVLTYTSTVGLEAASRGVPVAVAGATHYRGRGFTHDLTGPDALEDILGGQVLHMDTHELELAHRYAYAFFFRALIPFAGLGITGSHVGRIPTRDEIEPGRDPYLDLVCDRILDGREIFLPEELAPVAG